MRRGIRPIARFICLAVILVWAAAGIAEASVFSGAAQFIWPEEETAGWTLELGMNVQAYPPFGERRIELLNRLIRHLRLQIAQSGDTADIQLLIDGKQTPVRMTLSADALRSGDAAAAVPEGGGETDESGAGEAEDDWLSVGASAADQMHTVFQLLDAGADFLQELPELYPEGCSEKKIRQKLKTGIAVRSVTITLQPDEDGEHPMKGLIQSSRTKMVSEYLGQWVFRGRQRFTLLFDEENRLLKASCSGRAGETEETLRNISLEWRLLRSDSLVKDEVTLKTPAVDGSFRDNWILSREWKDAEAAEEETSDTAAESLSFTFEYDRKHGNSKAAYKWEGSLEGGGGISGGITWTRKQKNETETLTVRPAWTVCNEKQIEGTAEIIRVSDKVIQEQAVLEMNWQKVSGQAVDSAAMATGTEPAGEAISESLQRDVLRSILTMIPAEDLGYLLEDIPAGDQAAILEEAAK